MAEGGQHFTLRHQSQNPSLTHFVQRLYEFPEPLHHLLSFGSGLPRFHLAAVSPSDEVKITKQARKVLLVRRIESHWRPASDICSLKKE